MAPSPGAQRGRSLAARSVQDASSAQPAAQHAAAARRALLPSPHLLALSLARSLSLSFRSLAQIFNTVGSGVKGGGTPGYACYGATKRGLPQMTDSLVAELTKGVPGFDVDKPKGTVNVRGGGARRAATHPPTVLSLCRRPSARPRLARQPD